MRILFLSRWFPYPPANGSKIRVHNILRGLSQEHQVDLLSFFQAEDGAPDLDSMKAWCSQVDILPYRGFRPNSRRAWMGFLNKTPRAYLDTFSPELSKMVTSKLDRQAYDLVIASQIDMAGYARYFRGLPAVFEEVEVGTLYGQFRNALDAKSRLRHALTWFKHRRYLADLLKYYRACTVASPAEKETLESIAYAGTRIEVVPNCVDLKSYAGDWDAPDPTNLIFTGSFRFLPNYEGALWFAKYVLPAVRVAFPDMRLTITGDHAGLPFPPDAGVHLAGFVRDIRPWVAQAWCSVAPIFQGGGTRLKILEAMALGTPVVSTSKGAEGLAVQHGEHLLIADTPTEFAAAIANLRQNPDLRARIARNGLELIRRLYDWPVVMQHFREIIQI